MINLFSPYLDIETARVYLDDSLDRGALTNSRSDDSYVNQLGNVVAELMGFTYGVACSSGTVAAEVLISALLRNFAEPVIHMPIYNYGGLVNMVVDQALKWNSTVNLTSCSTDDYSANFDYGKYRSTHSLWINSYLYGNVGHYENHDTCIGDLSHLTGIDCSKLGLEHGFTSLYPTKNISAGEGGVVLTNSSAVAHMVTGMITGNFDKSMSYNRRMSELHAGIGLANAQGVKGRAMWRSVKYNYLSGLFHESFKPPEMDNPYMFIINLSEHNLWHEGSDKQNIINYLYDRGVESSFSYYNESSISSTLLRGASKITYDGEEVPVRLGANNLSGTQLAIPCHRDLTGDDMEYLGEAVNDALREFL